MSRELPPSVVTMGKQGRMTAPAKPDGGVRGIPGRWPNNWDAVEAATAPHQYALRTKSRVSSAWFTCSSTQLRRWTIVSFRHGVVRFSDTQQAMVKSHPGRFAGVHFTLSPHIAVDSLRRSGFQGVVASSPLAPSASACRCGRPHDDLGHHQSACTTSGVLGRRRLCT